MAYPTIAALMGTPPDIVLTEAAADLAYGWGSHLEIACLAYLPYEPAGLMEAGAVVSTALRQDASAELENAEARIRSWLFPEDIPWSFRGVLAPVGAAGAEIAPVIRFADIALVRSPQESDSAERSRLLAEAALFGANLPVLLLSRGPAPAMGRVLIAWDGSVPALNAVRAALPLLRLADKVEIALVAPPAHGLEADDPGAPLARWLSRHGVHSEIRLLARTMPRIADVLFRHAHESGAELMVMGAYGHSRLREAITGGVTRDVLDRGDMPVLLAH